MTPFSSSRIYSSTVTVVVRYAVSLEALELALRGKLSVSHVHPLC